MNPLYRIVIGDDHEHARQAMRLIIKRDSRFQIVGEAADGKEVIELAESARPDLILMDINMPKINGLTATRIIKEQFPSVKIVIVTVSDDASDLFDALKQGAQGYLLKNLKPSLWLEYLQAVAADETPMPKEIARRILHEFHTTPVPSKQSNLTQREQEILTWVAQGYSNKEIARQCLISEYTVKNHLKNIMQKLHLNNRVQLTRYAYEQGWMEGNDRGENSSKEG
ncbi:MULTISPECIES: response regulator transcription factor [Thermoactinomyces]|uniref:Response regulator transcription factor n=1 Tax=Thermoactinomyces vulgaris TaxID=2026 RepID=A0ABS0QJI0_THEVU|nr:MULTISPECIES: response regulator transcription factor [Thermoactinomyces]MBH8584366.1 response regulator transcription factor [Thermoactinomyces sp. CICC 10735]MBH8586856.1 response regulator transcription factor [Thermoactinomyces sp. CICC 10520]MBI0387977.1 response regulator transcription factor [Thermoactinomyces sp. CICC 24227]MBI0392742.1 response regulator transcription factor [Thermoactinomyces sp. CICC 24226]KFZ39811.1 chemotaxis protein CheY [Thermoactinomyces sp. Gus2-1]